MESPIAELRAEWIRAREVRLWIKRDDLLQPGGDIYYSGNKVRKLRYNLEAARTQGFTKLLTFGGAFSNHIAATARAGQLFGFQTIGIIRGEEHLPLNPTLAYASGCGMQLRYLSRTDFRDKYEPERLAGWEAEFGAFYLIPEGGTNALALMGVAEMVAETEAQLGFSPDFWTLSCGTGGTLAGLITGLGGRSRALGFPALKGDFMEAAVTSLLKHHNAHSFSNWSVREDYHFGGYARITPQLLDFIRYFEATFHIPLEPIYTGKLFFGLFDLIRKDYFPPGSNILAVHSGGLQGLEGFSR